VVGITAAEFSGTAGWDTADAVQTAVSRAYWLSLATMRQWAVVASRVGKTEMVVLIRDPFAEGKVPGFEGYVTMLFVNRTAQAACDEAGIKLNVIAEMDEDQLPQPLGRFVLLPLYFIQCVHRHW
jgi:hypothetical protein